MTDLVVSAEYLEKLASTQDDAAQSIGSAATAPSGIAYQIWVTHGLICGPCAQAVTGAENARSDAVAAVQADSAGLAAKLRSAEAMYEGTDHQASENLDKQVVSD
jgi:predicted metal-dependent HD superfamily phosphohydrolase